MSSASLFNPFSVTSVRSWSALFSVYFVYSVLPPSLSQDEMPSSGRHPASVPLGCTRPLGSRRAY